MHAGFQDSESTCFNFLRLLRRFATRNDEIRSAFTLAEVLIVLTIIGIVAALTIPAIMADKDKAAWTAQLEKTYAALENARRLTAMDYGGDISSLFSNLDSTHGNVALQAFSRHLILSKNCNANAGCWYDNMKNLDSTPFDAAAINGAFDTSYNGHYGGKVILADGTLLFFWSLNTSCSTDITNSYTPKAYANCCGGIYVDLNGKQPPNIWGRDIFRFVINRDGIYPSGVEKSSDDVNTNCTTLTGSSTVAGSGQGFYCATKVIKEGTENY